MAGVLCSKDGCGRMREAAGSPAGHSHGGVKPPRGRRSVQAGVQQLPRAARAAVRRGLRDAHPALGRGSRRQEPAVESCGRGGVRGTGERGSSNRASHLQQRRLAALPMRASGLGARGHADEGGDSSSAPGERNASGGGRAGRQASRGRGCSSARTASLGNAVPNATAPALSQGVRGGGGGSIATPHEAASPCDGGPAYAPEASPRPVVEGQEQLAHRQTPRRTRPSRSWSAPRAARGPRAAACEGPRPTWRRCRGVGACGRAVCARSLDSASEASCSNRAATLGRAEWRVSKMASSSPRQSHVRAPAWAGMATQKDVKLVVANKLFERVSRGVALAAPSGRGAVPFVSPPFGCTLCLPRPQLPPFQRPRPCFRRERLSCEWWFRQRFG